MLKTENKRLEDRIRYMQEHPEECCLAPILPLYTRDTMPVDQTSIYDHRPFEYLAPAPSGSDTEEA